MERGFSNEGARSDAGIIDRLAVSLLRRQFRDSEERFSKAHRVLKRSENYASIILCYRECRRFFKCAEDYKGEGILEAELNALVTRSADVFRRVEFELIGTLPQLDWMRERSCFQIVCECLGNAMKHGEATQIHILLVVRPGEIEISVSDNGNGGVFDWEDGPRSIKEHVRNWGGHFQMARNPRSGLTIIAVLPTSVALEGLGDEVIKRKKAIKRKNAESGNRISRWTLRRKCKELDEFSFAIQKQFPKAEVGTFSYHRNAGLIEISGVGESDVSWFACSDSSLRIFKVVPVFLQKDKVIYFLTKEQGKYRDGEGEFLREINFVTPLMEQLHHELGQWIHDSYCQSLVALAISVEMEMKVLSDDDHGSWQDLKLFSLSIHRAIESGRELSHGLVNFGKRGRLEKHPLRGITIQGGSES